MDRERTPPTPQERDIALCIDCDGTLLQTDLLHEALLVLAKRSPLSLLALPLWLRGGKAAFKHRLAEAVALEWDTLPVNPDVRERAQAARREGRHVVLATASHHRWAEPLAAELGLFDEVLASDGRRNLSGAAKADVLVERFGAGGFDYVGDSRKDLPVWAHARRAMVVSSDSALARAAQAARPRGDAVEVIASSRSSWTNYLRALRLHQWLKNLLIFVPLLTAHQLFSPTGLGAALAAFLAFSLCASSVYVINDLMDLAADRRHVRKRRRPFASAALPVWQGVVIAPALLLASAAITLWLLPVQFSAVLGAYFVATLLYSFWLKRQVIVDVLLLAGLYTIRVVAGGAATGIVPSFWLLAFAMFIFLSLALVKRYSELVVTLGQNKVAAAGRGYRVQDLPVLMALGAGSAMVAVMVFSLYINSPEVRSIYARPHWLWLVPPLLLYWVSRLWMKTHRGEIDDDPVVFAVRDWQSLLVLLATAAFFTIAR